MDSFEEKRGDHSRAKQTWIIAGAIMVSVVGSMIDYVSWQEANRDFSMMPPDSRCEYASYRSKHRWESESECKVDAAAARLSGRPFRDDNPYPR